MSNNTINIYGICIEMSAESRVLRSRGQSQRSTHFRSSASSPRPFSNIRKRLPLSVFPGFYGFKVEIRPGTPGFQLPPSHFKHRAATSPVRVIQCEQTRGQTGNRIKFRLPAFTHRVSHTAVRSEGFDVQAV